MPSEEAKPGKLAQFGRLCGFSTGLMLVGGLKQRFAHTLAQIGLVAFKHVDQCLDYLAVEVAHAVSFQPVGPRRTVAEAGGVSSALGGGLAA